MFADGSSLNTNDINQLILNSNNLYGETELGGYAYGGPSRLLGSPKDDVLIGGDGYTKLYGGDGFDTYQFDSGSLNDVFKEIIDSDG